MKFITAILLIMGVGTGSLFATADTVKIPLGSQSRANAAVDLPLKGMSQARVEELFGVPAEKKAPIGQPPITEWVYTEFSVYFEYTHVIHSVRHFKPSNTLSE